ncbi:MAG: type II toxin-antitoxin system VapC family toxin [Hyphomicrobiaceae bacterium]|nr:type II toxin-antitoxin system VapC family toxin [Hyphomicrobiaceae bacterium]
MTLLIDTHVLIWWLGDADLIPLHSRAMIADPENEVFVSAASAWEIALKHRNGKLRFNETFLADFDGHLQALRFAPLTVTSAHMVRGAHLDGQHKDPFDRILAGQALVERLRIVSADRAFDALGVERLWDVPSR